MTHEEAMSQIGSALPYLNLKVANDEGIVYVRAMIQFVRNEQGQLTRQWRYQQVDIGEDEWNPPNKPKAQCAPTRKFNWRDWIDAPTRVRNLAYKLQPESLEAMGKYSPQELRSIRGVGLKTVRDTQEYLQRKGYSLSL